jgi:hypothetical protein
MGQNVTAKLDKKHTDKMSQTLGQNITGSRNVTLWQTVKIYQEGMSQFGVEGQSVHFETEFHSSKMSQQTVCQVDA